MTPSLRLPLGRPAATRRGWRFRLQVPEDCPYFAGHFPGRPVLPAIAHLALVSEACRRVLGQGSLDRLDLLRLQHPVGPGAELELTLERPDPLGRIRFALRCGRRAVSAGTLRWDGGRGA